MGGGYPRRDRLPEQPPEALHKPGEGPTCDAGPSRSFPAGLDPARQDASAVRTRRPASRHPRQFACPSAEYSPDELAVIADWLTRAAALARTYLEDSR